MFLRKLQFNAILTSVSYKNEYCWLNIHESTPSLKHILPMITHILFIQMKRAIARKEDGFLSEFMEELVDATAVEFWRD